MKLVYVGDPHNRPTVPKNRTDNYHETYQEKVNEIKALVNTHQAKALLQPGDFLDAPKYDNAFLMKVVEQWSTVPAYQLLSDLRKGEVDSKQVAEELAKSIPFIGAIGNHELFGESIQSYPKTSLAFLEQIGFMILPSKEKPFILTDDDGTTVAITSSHYHAKMDTDAYLDDYIVEKKAADFHIHMVHGYLTNRDMGELFKHTTLDKIAHETQADLTIAGHDHIGFPLTEVDGKWFINPGSMTRTKNDIKEMSRHPKALVVEITKQNGVQVEEVLLETAKKGNQVLSREAINEKQAKTIQMEEIKSVVNQAQVKQGTSIATIVKNIGEVKNVDQSVVDEVVELVTQKMEEMNPAQDEKADPYTIKKLTLENFQSHSHTAMELSEGLNVIIGESSHGKSSIYRALNWLYDNAGANPRTFIKKGTTHARVTIELTNGYRISRIVESKRSGKNGYEIYDPHTKDVITTNTKGADTVRQLLGFYKVPLDGGKELDINFMGQGESWFFIGKHVTSSERAKIIGSIFGTHYTDSVLKDMEGTLKKTDTQLKAHKKQWDETVEEIKMYDYLEEMEKRLEKAKTHYAHIQELTVKKQTITRLIQKREVVRQEEEAWTIKLDSVKDVDKARLRFAQIQSTLSKHEAVKRSVVLLERNKKEEETWTRIEESVKDVEKGRKSLVSAKERIQKKESLDEQLKRHNALKTRLEQLTNLMNDASKVIDQTKQAKNARQAIALVKEKQTRLMEQQAKWQVYTQLTERIQKGYVFLMEKERELNTTLDEYEENLIHAGTCPTCFSSIDSLLVKQVVGSRRA